MSVPARAAALLVAVAAVVGLGIFVALYYIGSASSLPTVHYSASNGVVNVVLQEDPQNDSSSKPDWVSYYVQDPNSKQWVHTTFFSVPANTKVNMTIYGYDGCTPLRNNFYSGVQGTIGGTVTVSQFDQHGKEYVSNDTTSLINAWSDCNVGHTFAIPSLGVYVPVASPNANLSANNLCSSSPCTHAVATRTRWRRSASWSPVMAGYSAGSAWSRAAAVSSMATAARCRPSVT